PGPAEILPGNGDPLFIVLYCRDMAPLRGVGAHQESREAHRRPKLQYATRPLDLQQHLQKALGLLADDRHMVRQRPLLDFLHKRAFRRLQGMDKCRDSLINDHICTPVYTQLHTSYVNLGRNTFKKYYVPFYTFLNYLSTSIIIGKIMGLLLVLFQINSF